jgi:hypothetical protein
VRISRFAGEPARGSARALPGARGAAEERRALPRSRPRVLGLVLGAGRQPALYLRIGRVL